VAEFVRCAEQFGLPRIVSIQNACHLMNRSFESGLAEVCRHAGVGLLAYSPLAFGHLSGKYLADPQARGRITLFPGFGQRYSKPNVPAATAEYVRIAREAGLSPSAMALAWARTRWYVDSVILGATTLEQLRENLDSMELILKDEVLERIEMAHRLYPNPAP
jgi:aryl-alcohol dehydrogenase-like predicted oxidoreductase